MWRGTDEPKLVTANTHVKCSRLKATQEALDVGDGGL